jgi:hypothetical protein
MIFPEYVLLSKNYYNKGWSLKTYRRLKNIIVILDVIIDVNQVALTEGPNMFGKNLTATQEENLLKAFRLFDVNGRGQLT